MHAVACDADWYEPATHSVHLLSRAAAAIVPGAHVVGMDAPVGHAEPAGQIAQSPEPLPSPCAVAPGKLRCVPASHAVGALAPSAQYEPLGQSKHAVSPLDD